MAAVPSSLLLGVTSYVASNIASLPFLWVLPLSLYLLTFVVVFSPSQRIRALPDALTRMPLFARSMASWVLPVAVTAALVGVTIAATSSVVWLGLLHLMIFFVLALHLHRQLADRRPPPRRLGEYYVWMGIGGALGGVLNAVVAPLVFTRVHEYPFILAVALMLRPALFKERVRALDLLLPLALGVAALAVPWGARATGYLAPGFDLRYLLALPAAIAFAFYARPLRFGLAVLALLWASSFYPGSAGWPSYVARSFYNVHRVLDDHANGIRWLENGNTLHGAQSPRDPDAPLGYYHRTGPLGDIFKEPRAPARTAVVGLGAGAMLAYARADEPWTVYEIDPTVVEIARDSGYFSYLERSRATPKVILGDGRLGLAAALPGAFDLIVVDAFGSDAVPVHLLTEEALDLYWSRLGSSPRLLFHVSNRYLNLAPLIGGWALARGLSAWEKIDLVEEEDERRLGKMSSHWILVSRAAPPEGWAMVPARAEGGLRWTDGHSSLLYLLGVARQ